MKKLYVLAGALFMATGAFAQGHELFLSAYDEGAHASGSVPPGGGTASQGNERAMQIFNPTTSAVPVERYSLARYSNGIKDPAGNPVIFQEEKLQKNQPTLTANYSLPSNDVFVIGAFKATLLDIVNNWDQKSSDYGPVTNSTVITQGGPIHFDGNDAMVLRRWTGATAGQGTPIIVDILGVMGEDPAGGAWFSNPPAVPVTVATKNMSLNRKSNIEHGVTSTTAGSYQIGDEWEVFSAWNGVADPTGWFAQDYSNLASHTYTGKLGAYSPTGVLEDFDRAINVYPNPTTNKNLNISIKNTKVSEITILNSVGQNIKVVPANAASADIKVDVSSLKPGLYFVKFVSDNEYKTTIYKTVLVQ